MSSTPPEGQRARRPRRWGRLWRLLSPYDRLPIDPDLAPDDPGAPAVGHRPSTVSVHRRDPRVLASIGVGGFIGTFGRYEVARTWPVHTGTFPLTTLFINTSGAFALGLILTFILERWAPSPYLRPFACVGVLGAWTTMSTLATESDVLAKDGHLLVALAYVAATLVAGVSAAALGIALAGRREPAP